MSHLLFCRLQKEDALKFRVSKANEADEIEKVICRDFVMFALLDLGTSKEFRRNSISHNKLPIRDG